MREFYLPLEAGLPNILAGFDLAVPSYNPTSPSGAISHVVTSQNNGYQQIVNNNFSIVNVDFKASKSNPIYGNSSTVQPPAIQLIPQIKY